MPLGPQARGEIADPARRGRLSAGEPAAVAPNEGRALAGGKAPARPVIGLQALPTAEEPAFGSLPEHVPHLLAGDYTVIRINRPVGETTSEQAALP
jgi:hypothetical protein